MTKAFFAAAAIVTWTIVSINPGLGQDSRPDLVIELTCPTNGSGVYKSLRANEAGERARATVHYEGGEGRTVALEVALPGHEDFFHLGTIDIKTENRPDTLDAGRKEVAHADKIVATVCQGTDAEREKYLQTNRQILGLE